MGESPGHPGVASFFELDARLPVLRRAFVEAVGTALLVVAMVGAGLAAEPYSKDAPLVASILVAFSIAGALVGLIVALGKVSGGHFNPLITISQWLTGERGLVCAVSYIVGQLLGGLIGTFVAMLMFSQAGRIHLSGYPSTGLVVSEVVASMGLMTVVLGCARSTKWETGPFAVGAWLVAAIMATPSASYANPAVTLAAVFASGLVALSPQNAAIFVLAQLAGMLMAVGINIVVFHMGSTNGKGAGMTVPEPIVEVRLQ